MKEIEYLKLNLESAKKEAKHTISNYKSAMDKIRELELVNNIILFCINLLLECS